MDFYGCEPPLLDDLFQSCLFDEMDNFLQETLSIRRSEIREEYLAVHILSFLSVRLVYEINSHD